MKKKKLTALALSLILIAGITAGCANDTKKQDKSDTDKNQEAQKKDENPNLIRAAALKGPTAMGMVKLMDNAAQKKAANDYTFSILASPDEIVPKIVKGDLDLAAVPANLASVLYQKTDRKVKVAAINTLGVLYLVENGNTVKSAEDLKGKTIYASGKGATPEYTLNTILKSAGLTPGEDVTVEYKSEHAEVVASLAKDDKAVGLLPQPFVTTAMMKNENLRVALDLNKTWEALQKDGSSLVTGVVIVRSEFAEKNPDALDAFLREYKTSTDFTNNEIEQSAALIEKYDIVPAAVAKKAIPECNITCITGSEMQKTLSAYLKTLNAQNPETIGGTLPDDNFYYTK